MLSYTEADSSGYSPDFSLIGKVYRHFKNKKCYVITGFSWLGNSDRWLINYTEVNGIVAFTRTPSNMFEMIHLEGFNTPRFLLVEDFECI